jgi:hypothetical protein
MNLEIVLDDFRPYGQLYANYRPAGWIPGSCSSRLVVYTSSLTSRL